MDFSPQNLNFLFQQGSHHSRIYCQNFNLCIFNLLNQFFWSFFERSRLLLFFLISSGYIFIYYFFLFIIIFLFYYLLLLFFVIIIFYYFYFYFYFCVGTQKWVTTEANTYVCVTQKVVKSFIEKDLICSYGLPTRLIIDNAQHFNEKLIIDLYTNKN